MRSFFARIALVAFAPVALAAACGGDEDTSFPSSSSASSSDATTSTTDATTGTGGGGQGGAGGNGSGGGGGTPGVGPDCSAAEGATPPLTLTLIASGLSHPTLLKSAPGDATRLFVLEQKGTIRIIKDGVLQEQPFLDISSEVTFNNSNTDERGFLGFAFHPDYQNNGRIFVHYSNSQSGGDARIAEVHRMGNDPDHADASTLTSILSVDQPEVNHNGGAIEFSPVDGMLYIGLGDGGGAEDMHGPIGNGQELGTHLGKMLRIDVTTLPYTIPAGNMTGANVLPEIWSYGLRNPWRFGFDQCTNDLYIGDVGQYEWEEVDVEPPGQGGRNYGWRLMEGTHCFNPSTNCDPGGLTMPIAEYSHTVGCSITGGYVYRGSAIPGLRGTYLYGDYCKGKIWGLTWQNGTASVPVDLTSDLQSSALDITSFGQDLAGEIYVLHQKGDIYRIDAE